MSLISGLFNVFALIYLFRGVQLAVQIGRNWQENIREPLTPYKKHLAEQAAFFVGVPISVFIHELFHALAIWLFGGRVVEFGYRVFWGYVVPAGEFTPAQDWFIALAGTLGSLLFGFSVWALLRRRPSRSLQYFGLRTFRFQIYFSLVYYPLFSIFLPIGDWRTIYDFGATPLLSGLTAVLQGLSLYFFWRADRRGWFEMAAFDSVAAQAGYESRAATAMQPGADPRERLWTIDALRRGGAERQAKAELQRFLIDYPNSAEGRLQLAALEAEGKSQVSRDAADQARQALAMGLSQPGQVAYARQLLARHYLERGDGHAALEHLEPAIEALRGPNGIILFEARPQAAQLYQLLSQAHRRLGDFEAAADDARRAVALAEAAGDPEAAARYRNELEVVTKNAGRPLPQGAREAPDYRSSDAGPN